MLVVMDTARADVFEPYGASPGATPAIAQVAAMGEARHDVFSTANWTVPAHASLFSGLHPGAIGLAQVPDGPLSCRSRLEGLTTRLLPEVLRGAGYATAGVSTNMWITDKSGFASGFDRFEVVRPEHRARLDGVRLRDRLRWDFDAVHAREDDGAEDAAKILGRWMSEPRDGPFFWFVNLTECHSPYLPPRPYNDLSLWGRLRAGEEARRHLTLWEIWKACLGASVIPPAAIRRMRHLYERSIRYMDDWLARVLDGFDRTGILDDTVVIVTSDHGENLGESNLIGHAFSLDDRLIRVPFVSSHPDLLGGSGAQSLADVPGALATLAGVDDHPYAEVGTTTGIAVAELQRLLEPSDPRVEETCARWQLDDWGRELLTTSAWCATDGRYKLLCREDKEVLFDLEVDPLETAPVALGQDRSGPHAGVVTGLRKVGEETIGRRWDVPGVAPLHAGDADPRSQVSPEELDAIEAQMRRLGYL